MNSLFIFIAQCTRTFIYKNETWIFEIRQFSFYACYGKWDQRNFSNIYSNLVNEHNKQKNDLFWMYTYTFFPESWIILQLS